MFTITIYERRLERGDAALPSTPESFNAVLSFNGEGEFPLSVRNPFLAEAEQELEWYFEQHLRFPFVGETRAQAAAASVATYGETLFSQVFADREAYSNYKTALQAGVENLCFEVIGSPDFHQLHWEALKDPQLPQPLALQAPMIRRTTKTQTLPAVAQASPTINLLLVVARPDEGRDVAYRTISRPLIEMLRQARLRVQVDFVRPGTYEALDKHLQAIQEKHGTGYYHVVHFDAHGAVCSHDDLRRAGTHPEKLLYQQRYGRPDLAAYDGQRAFLFLESEKSNQADPVEASELANLLLAQRIPIVILNACQSGKQIGASETSLGSRLLQAGVQVVLAMGYSVTVSAAELMMKELYERLFAGSSLPSAIRRARQQLYNNKERRAYFNQTVKLEDWLLPVVYQNRAQTLTVRNFTPDEERAYYERQAVRFPFPRPTYGFAGRDLDILRIEKRLLQHNLLLVRGMGGAGKTTLLRHLAAWWQTTNFVERVFYFGYDERAWTRQQILDEIARQLLTAVEYASFQPLSLGAQQAALAERLRGQRHLLVLDNLESITGAQLAIQNTLPPTEQAALRQWLSELAGGKTIVLLGSRGGEDWLRPGTFDEQIYDLPGLDDEAAAGLAKRILEKFNVSHYRQEADFRRLLKLLAGYPLALEVVLANLVRQTPAQILTALQAGDVALDRGDAQTKTESILRCIEYSHGNLSPDAQGLLGCLAPFALVINEAWIEPYLARLKQQPELAHLPFERWAEILREAMNWGLVSREAELPDYLRLQPIFPYFLRAQLNAPEHAATLRAIETAFRQHYDGIGQAIAGGLQSKEPQERMAGQILARLEFENLLTALQLALQAQVSIRNPYAALSRFLDSTQEHQRGLAMGQMVLASLEQYDAEKLTGMLGAEFVGILGDLAKRQVLLKEISAAEVSYQRALELTNALGSVGKEVQGKMRASIYHQLGYVAQEQRQWLQAEQYHQQALAIKIEFNDRYEQAGTYHQLGRVAQEQRQWLPAEQYFQQALAIFIEFNDRYAQAITYHQLGSVAEEQRRWLQAEQYYQQALAIFIEFNDRYKQAGTYHQLGIVAEEQRQWPQAEQYFQQALAIKIEFNDRYAQAGTYHQLGRVAQAQEQWPQAQDYLLKALAIFAEYQDKHSLGIALRSLARLWQASGDHRLPEVVAQQLGAALAKVETFFRKTLEAE